MWAFPSSGSSHVFTCRFWTWTLVCTSAEVSTPPCESTFSSASFPLKSSVFVPLASVLVTLYLSLKPWAVLRVDHLHHVNSYLFKRFPSYTSFMTLVTLTFSFWEAPVFATSKLLHQQHLVQAGIEKDHPTCRLASFPFLKLNENFLQTKQVMAETIDPWEDLGTELFERKILLWVRVIAVTKFKLLLCCEAIFDVVPLASYVSAVASQCPGVCAGICFQGPSRCLQAHHGEQLHDLPFLTISQISIKIS